MEYVKHAIVFLMVYGAAIFLWHAIVKYFPRDVLDRIMLCLPWRLGMPNYVGVDFPDVKMTECYEDEDGAKVYKFRDIGRFTMYYIDDDGEEVKVEYIHEKISIDDDVWYIGFKDKEGFFLSESVDANMKGGE